MSAADLATVAGAFLAAVISSLGLRRGEAEKRGLPAPDPALSAGVFVGMEAETQRSILEVLREIRADMAAWRRQDEAERRAYRDRTAVQRFEQIEDNQAAILGLLHRIEGSEARRERGERRPD